MSDLTPMFAFSGLLALLFWPLRAHQWFKTLAIFAVSLAFVYFSQISATWFFVLTILISTSYIAALGLPNRPRITRGIRFGFIALMLALFLYFKLLAGDAVAAESQALTVMPLGFSFFMFQSIALMLDAEGHTSRARPDLAQHLRSSLFFPALPSGPYIRSEQLREIKALDKSDHFSWLEAYSLFCLGVFKIAASELLLRRQFIGQIPLPDSHLATVKPFVLMLMASVYLYANFSGFSDIAVSLARWMGYEIPPNFHFPFFSGSLAEYWRRWHLTLGQWFRDYIFTPLHLRLMRMSLPPIVATAAATAVTFGLIGLWHGISLKYLAWAALNTAFVLYTPFRSRRVLKFGATIAIILFSNTLFLSRDLTAFGKTVSHLFEAQSWNFSASDFSSILLSCGLVAIFSFTEKMVGRIGKQPQIVRLSHLAVSFLLCWTLLFIGIAIGIGSADSIYSGF